MFCRDICRNLQNFYIQNHHIKYIKILADKEYQTLLGLSKKEVQKNISFIWREHLRLAAYDHIVRGKRQKK